MAAVAVLGASTAGLVPAQANDVGSVTTSSARISAVINFEITDEPCNFIDVNPLRDLYKGLGVHFRGPSAKDGAAILDECSNFSGLKARSGEAFLAVGQPADLLNGGKASGPITIRFDHKQRSVGVWIAPGGAGPETFKLVGKRGGKSVRSGTLSTSSNTFQRLKTKAKEGIWFRRHQVSFVGRILAGGRPVHNQHLSPPSTGWFTGSRRP